MRSIFLPLIFVPFLAQAAPIEADLLIVGGNESGCAAAVQAARLGVARVVLVSDIAMLGGQFSAEGVGNVDEWTTVNGQRVEFPRSGLFLEVAQAIEETNRRKFGTAQPGNSFCARLTIEPAEAARIFEDLLAPQVAAGRLRVERGWEPVTVDVAGNRVTGVSFTKGKDRLEVRARLTMDASDWGDVIRLSGAKWSAGPDAKSRFAEPSAPEEITDANRREMNPLSWCVVLCGTADESVLPEPEGFEARRYFGASRETKKDFDAVGWPKGVLFMNVPMFADTRHEAGPYSPPVNIYTHRRLVDAAHQGWPHEREKLFLNWPVQDYPLDQWPKPVADALDTTEPGASAKNIAALTPAQRRIVFDDAKRHALGLLYHLQKADAHFRRLELTDEFGTSDRLPPKPYIREGLRLEALTMLREQDLRTPHPEPRWARTMPGDAVFGFQFNIDFHPTRRVFLGGDPAGPWATIHTATRNWNTHTDRGMFPLRGLVPIERDGLLGASKNIGVSSVVQSALRLHGQMMLCGQASATVAWRCLREGIEPRALAGEARRVREVQRELARGHGGPGVLLWPYHDLPPEHAAFEAANLLSVAGVWRADADGVFFQPEKAVSSAEWGAAVERAPAAARETLRQQTPATRAAAVRALLAAMDFDELMIPAMRTTALTVLLLSARLTFAADTGVALVVTNTHGLVAFWTFGEEAGQPRVSTGTKEKHPLQEVGGPIARVAGGPFSGYAAELNGKQYFRIPYAETGDLNISGPDAQVSMFAVVRIVNLKQSRTIAGMWSEGKGANDDTGTRQYALLMNMPTYGGPNKLVPHISSEGGVTRRADGSAFPWCADYAVTAGEVPTEQWCTLGFTYDGKFLRAYLNGRLDELKLDPEKHKRTDRYFTSEGPDGKDRGMNPYYHGRGIFRYDPALHAQTKPGGGAEFTVGARYAVGKMLGEATIGKFGGLAVFNRALTDAEMKKLHDAANLGAVK